MSKPSCVGGYRDILESILTDLIPLDPPITKKSKVIHDALWGSRLYYPWEVAILDTPLLQRLRQISQLGTAFLTYPSAVHNRFSHSLGVTILAGRLLVRLREKAKVDEHSDLDIIEKDIYTVRMAGLLHDVGHCFFSHCSESLMYEFRDECFDDIRKTDGFTKRPKPHELTSYLIVTSERFKEYWEKFIVPAYFEDQDAPDPLEMAKLIVGISPGKERKYLQEIISGPYDVDKLEYLYRDAKMAGLSISYDIERFFYKVIVSKRPNGTRRLVMEEGGVRAVEQLIFSKMMLFSFVYHHQKILASDSVVVDMLEELLVNGGRGDIIVRHPLDFLRYTDAELLSEVTRGPTDRFRLLRQKVRARKLPKRCFSMNREFIVDESGDEDAKLSWDRLKEDSKNRHKRRGIRRKIVEEIKREHPREEIDIDKIYLNIPKPPKLEESIRAPIENGDGNIVGMEEFQNIEGWQKTYELKKFRGYFFAEEPLVEKAAKAVKKVLLAEYGLLFSENSFKEAKLPV